MHARTLTEHQEQSLLIQWANYNPWWRLLFAIPNGGDRHPAVGKKLKAEGVRAGVPDLFLAKSCGGFHGLFIEMKTKKGRPTQSQLEYIDLLHQMGFCAKICYCYEDAKDTIERYLNGSL